MPRSATTLYAGHLRPPLQISEPRMSLRPTLRLLSRLACLLGLIASAHAQLPTVHPPVDPHNIVLPNLNHPADITANWLIHQGDDPTYASPTLDDSHWTVIDITKPLASYGIVKPNFVWYRTHVHIAPGQHHLAILLRSLVGSEQIYVNGVPTGPSVPFDNQGGTIFGNFDIRSSIPDSLIASGNLTIAIRVQTGAAAKTESRAPGLSVDSLVQLGDASVLADQTSLRMFREFTSNYVIISLGTLVFLIALALALTLRDEPEYVALCIFLASTVASDILFLWRQTHYQTLTRFYDLPSQLLLFTLVLSGFEFARGVLRLPNSRWIRAYRWAVGSVMIFGAVVDVVTFQVGFPNHAWPFILFFATVLLIVVPLNLGLPIFALWIWRRTRNFDALLLSIPLLVKAAFFYIEFSVSLLNLLHITHSIQIPLPPTGSFDIQWSEIADFFFLLSLLGFLILRTVRLARARAALSAELAAAQHVQQLLLTGSSRPTPGFRVETAFHPAAQVGGDFFLLSPYEDGSLFAIVGDVSGKGLTAAMRVAMILGILRRETSRDPAAVLANLNDALLSQSEMGFTTALCVHLFPDGTFTAANAGHIPPYIAGIELETPPALPLGLAPDQFYEFITGHLAPTQTMVLMSDGVPEARNPQRELYGFDRLPHLTLLPASEIANTALRFGQEDDITVLTLAVAA
jgi:hypothetical protein